MTLTMSHVAALQEVRDLLRAIGIKQGDEEEATSPSTSELELPKLSGTIL